MNNQLRKYILLSCSQQFNSFPSIEEVTGEPHAKMQWLHYFRNVIQRYQVVVEGWPASIPFTNLSKVSSALPQLEMLLCKWQSGATYWRSIDDDEFKQLRQEHDEKLESGEISDHQRRTRSDKGKKHKRPAGADIGRSGHRKKYKSAEVIAEDSSDTDNGDEQHDGPVPAKSPAPRPLAQPSVSSPDAPSMEPPASLGMPEYPTDTMHTLNHGFSIPPFDFDATMARLDELYGPIDLQGTLTSSYYMQ
jgi:hypothetical protein